MEHYVVFNSATGAEAYRAQGPAGSAELQQLGEGLVALVIPASTFNSSPLNMPLIKASWAAALDVRADNVRSQFITNTPGQMATYVEKEAEARRILAGESSPIPFLSCEADAIGCDVTDLAHEVVAQADAWRIIGARIEAARRKAKLGIASAANLGELYRALQVDWSAVAAPVEAAPPA